jgi:aminopeptidase
MTDPRYTKLANLLVNYSTKIKRGDHALLDMIDVPDEFSIELVRAVRAAGGTPLIEVRHTRVSRELLLGITDTQAAQIRDI